MKMEREKERNDRVLMEDGASEVSQSPTAASLLRIYRSFAGLCSQFVCGYDAETHVNLSRVSALCELLLFIAFSARLLLFFSPVSRFSIFGSFLLASSLLPLQLHNVHISSQSSASLSLCCRASVCKSLTDG